MKYNKILVTGSSGFIGSHMADTLEENGYQVILFDVVPSNYKTKTQEEFIGDILNPDDITTAIKGCDAVYHFAALADLDEALDNPAQTVEVNLLGTINILEACRKNNVERFIYASTVYVHSREGGFYRCSKVAAEQYIQEYHNRYGINYCILRYGSLYGPRSGEDNGLWQIINNAIITGELQYMGNPESLREYIHVDDAAKSSLMALNNDFKNQRIILSGQEPMRVFDLLKMIGEILDIKKDIIFQDNTYTGHYIRTPYSYNEKIGKKYIPSMHVDMGQGLIQLINEIKNSKSNS
jgi:UDP-glucose 4-epimerase|tara:strand:- start:277 stop:1161 length:885 start_codon:yes stop_codon:yes gene_type:complete